MAQEEGQGQGPWIRQGQSQRTVLKDAGAGLCIGHRRRDWTPALSTGLLLGVPHECPDPTS